MLSKITQAYSWIKVNIKIILFSICVGVLMIFCSWVLYKNRRISALEEKIATLAAKLQIEKVTIEYGKSLTDLKTLQQEDAEIRKRLQAIEDSLRDRLPVSLTAEEIVQKFKEIGL